ncbi:hypothetical protein M422DRAFT_90557, partial [Sphaerobolus stellatus SS14]
TDFVLAERELKQAFPAQGAVSTDKAELESYGSSTASYHPTSPHTIIVRVKSTGDVVRVVKIAKRFRIPITVYSGGTSLEGHFGGVS